MAFDQLANTPTTDTPHATAAKPRNSRRRRRSDDLLNDTDYRLRFITTILKKILTIDPDATVVFGANRRASKTAWRKRRPTTHAGFLRIPVRRDEAFRKKFPVQPAPPIRSTPRMAGGQTTQAARNRQPNLSSEEMRLYPNMVSARTGRPMPHRQVPTQNRSRKVSCSFIVPQQPHGVKNDENASELVIHRASIMCK